jgi:hypothetical protein
MAQDIRAKTGFAHKLAYLCADGHFAQEFTRSQRQKMR